MGSVTSTVTLNVSVPGIDQLEKAQTALEKLEAAAGKGIEFNFKSGELTQISKDVDSINTKLQGLGKDVNFNKNFAKLDFSKLETGVTQLETEMKKLGDIKINGNQMIDTSGITSAISTIRSALTDLQTQMNNTFNGSTSKNGKSSSSSRNSMANYTAQLDKVMASFSKYYATAEKQVSDLNPFKDFDSGSIKAATEAAEQYQRIINDLQMATTKTGKTDTDMLKAMGWSDDQIKNVSTELKGLSTDYKAAMEMIKVESKGLDFKKLFGDSNQFQKYGEQIDQMGNKIAKLGDSAAKANLTQLQTQLNGFYASAQQAFQTGDFNGFVSSMSQVKDIMQEMNVSMDALNANSFGGNFMSGLSSSFNTVANVVNRMVGYNAIYREMRQVAQEMVSTVKEIDTAMTQLQIVTGASETEMTDFFESSISQAKELGQSVTDVLDSIQVYSRLGYDLADASELAEYTSILSNVAAVDVDEATTGLTSVIKGFDMEVSDAEHVADVLIDIGQNYAVSAGEILEAFTRSSAAFGATGTTFEEASAIIAAGNAAVQDASTVGVAMKTVSARIRQSKTELDELGESYDDLADGFSKYRDEIMQLTGFDIMEEGTTDDYKSLYDIFDGIAQVWDDLTETQQSRVSEILGGTRQLQVISSIINNWDDAASAYAEAMDSAGVATEAQATWMTSLQADFCLIVQKCAMRTHLIAGNA